MLLGVERLKRQRLVEQIEVSVFFLDSFNMLFGQWLPTTEFCDLFDDLDPFIFFVPPSRRRIYGSFTVSIRRGHVISVVTIRHQCRG